MNQAIGDILPSAVGVAVSPVPIIAVILMLATPRGRVNGPIFAAGWVVGLVGVSILVLVAAGGASDPATATGVRWGKLLLGVLFLALAVAQWRRRPAPGADTVLPGWMQTVDAFTPGRAFGFGVLLSAVNPKNLALTVAATATIAAAAPGLGGQVAAVAVFVGIASVTVVGPVVFAVLAPAASAGSLARVKDTMAAHNAVIMAVLLVVLGAKLIGDGLGG